MITLGVFAAHLGGRALWLFPPGVVSVIVAAGLMGMAGIGVPCVETGIGLSVVVPGLVVAFQLSFPAVAAMALVGFFAVFHGHAYGAEMRKRQRPCVGAGFVCATALLHAVGIGFVLGTEKFGDMSCR